MDIFTAKDGRVDVERQDVGNETEQEDQESKVQRNTRKELFAFSRQLLRRIAKGVRMSRDETATGRDDLFWQGKQLLAKKNNQSKALQPPCERGVASRLRQQEN